MLNLLKKLKPQKKENNEETEPLVARSPSGTRNTQGATTSDTSNRQAESVFNPETARTDELMLKFEIKYLKDRLQDKNLLREAREKIESDCNHLEVRLATIKDQMIQYNLKNTRLL